MRKTAMPLLLEQRIKAVLQEHEFCQIAGVEFPVDELYEIISIREVSGEHISQYARYEPDNINGWIDQNGRVQFTAVLRYKEDGNTFGMIFTTEACYLVETLPHGTTILEASNA